MSRNSNDLDPDAFDEIYLKAIDASLNFANSPSQRRNYANGFSQAIELYHQYLTDEKIGLEEAERRVGLILETLLDDKAAKTFAQRKGG